MLQGGGRTVPKPEQTKHNANKCKYKQNDARYGRTLHKADIQQRTKNTQLTPYHSKWSQLASLAGAPPADDGCS